MADVIAALQSALTITGKLRELSKKIEDADFKMLLADLAADLADAKVESAELKTRLARLLEENRGLSERLVVKDSTKPTLINGVYQFAGEEGFFCTGCFDARAAKIRVNELSGPFRQVARWRCPSCKSTYH